MKILMLTHHFFPTNGGIESFTLGLSKALKENNFEPNVVCLDIEPVSGRQLPKEEIISGIPVRRVGFIDLKFYKIAFGILKEIKKADIVHVQNIGFLSDFAVITKFLHKKPVVISTHGGISHKNERLLLKGIYSKWLDFLLKKADCVIADSEADFSMFEKKAKTIRLVENGVELDEFFGIERKPVKDSFLFVGRLAKNKRIDLLLEAFAPVLKEKENAILRIVGNDFDNILYDLRQKAIDLEIANRVFFSESITAQQLRFFLSQSEFFVSSSEYESFGISAVEAMAAGCVPILNDITAFRAFVKDGNNGYLVNFAETPLAAARILLAMNADETVKKQQSENAKAVAMKYSWKNSVKGIISVYEGIKKMKIALINDFLPSTGIGNYAFSLFEELKKKTDIEMLFLDSENKMTEKKDRIRVFRGARFPVLRHVLNNALVFGAKIPQGYDIYHASNQHISHLVSKKNAGIVSCMDIISKRLAADYNPIVNFFWNNSLGKMKHAKRIIAISNFTKREIIRQLGIPKEKIEVIPLAYDSKNFMPLNRKDARRELGVSESAKIVLNVGSEEKRKNIPTLLKAFAVVLEKNPGALLLRIGEQRQETKHIIETLKLDGKVMYLNNLSAKQLALAYNAADALAFCSYYEGFGLPVLEAMACGCPVIAAKAASVPEIVEEAGILVGNPLDEKEFAGAISAVFEDFGLKKKLERKGLVQARKFGWKKNAEATLAAYEGVLK